ncbi:MAG: PP2C family protein-serine/threonine phosphatase [Deinococcota bacterium]
MDVSNLDLASHGVIDVTGTWAFFPNEFIDPLSSAPAMRFLSSDDIWEEDDSLSQYGYGSYRMEITLPETATRYSLEISPRYVAYDLYVNGERVAQNGTIGETAAASQIAYEHKIVHLSGLTSNRLTIVFHMSNFEFPETSLASGRSVGIELWHTEDIQTVSRVRLANNAVALGVYGALCIFCAGIAGLNRRKKDTLFFSGLCLVLFLDVFTLSENGFGVVARASWLFRLRFDQSLTLGIVLTALFYGRELFPHEYPKRVVRIFAIPSLLFIAANLVLPLRFALITFRNDHYIFFAYLVYALVAACVSLIRRRDNAKLLFVGIAAATGLTLAAEYVDLLGLPPESFFMRNRFLVAQYATYFFLASQALLLSRRSAKIETDLRDRSLSLQKASSQIADLNQRLHAENTRMEDELQTTRRLQEMLLPNQDELNVFDHISISAAMEPASEVGGDYYDVLTRNETSHTSSRQHVDNHHVTIGIGDITGHGLESGMLMLMTQMGIKTLLEAGISDIETVLTVLNRSLYANVLRMGAERSLTLGLLDYYYQPPAPSDLQHNANISGAGEGYLRFCGQHEALLVFRADGTVEEYDTIDLGFPVALEEDIGQWVNSLALTLHAGDGVVLYTDGITEAENDRHQMYGLARLIDCIQRAWHKSTEQIKWAVLADLEHFIGDKVIHDDVTLVILKQL